MTIVKVGLSHHTAPVEIRERLALRTEELPEAIDDFLQNAPIAEAAVLSTCNRSETYVASGDTGRTVRAALDECSDFGRPRRILLCVLIDRGGRELPIQADIVGHKLTAGPGERVDVLVTELDGRDAVELVRP